MSQQRLVLCLLVRSGQCSVTTAARECGVSRKTAYKWLARHRLDPLAPAVDRSRRPHLSPTRTLPAVEGRVLALRDAYRWGPRKIFHALRRDHAPPDPLPALRTVAVILKRHGRVEPVKPTPDAAPLRFERPAPNDLWQLDFKSPLEINRRRCCPLTILDDHSRYLLAFKPCADMTTSTAFAVLWEVFGEAGMPEELLCDNAFGKMGTPRPAGISWFDSRVVRLGIYPIHGRPYHPQTQGKVEALHASAQRELLRGFNGNTTTLEAFETSCNRWRETYNTLRPHEALGDESPVVRYRPSPRRRPAKLPELQYDPGCTLRRVAKDGAISYCKSRILVGKGVAGDWVKIEESDHALHVYYGFKRIREVTTALLGGRQIL